MNWPSAVERVAKALRDAAVDARIEEFEGGTPTAREAAAAVGCELAQIVKSLVFVADGAYALVLVPGDRRANERVIAAALGASEVRVANAEEVVAATGFDPGGVAPFPQHAVSYVLMDRALLGHEEVWVGAGSERHMAALAPQDVARLSRARMFDGGGGG